MYANSQIFPHLAQIFDVPSADTPNSFTFVPKMPFFFFNFN